VFRATMEVLGPLWRLAGTQCQTQTSFIGARIFGLCLFVLKEDGEGNESTLWDSGRLVDPSTVLTSPSLIGLRGKTTY
jgi:hypothetical protein